MGELVKPRRAAGTVMRDVEEDTVIVAPSGVAVILNSVGGAVVELCDGERTVDDIVEELCSALPAPSHARVREDVVAFLGQLERAGCVVES